MQILPVDNSVRRNNGYRRNPFKCPRCAGRSRPVGACGPQAAGTAVPLSCAAQPCGLALLAASTPWGLSSPPPTAAPPATNPGLYLRWVRCFGLQSFREGHGAHARPGLRLQPQSRPQAAGPCWASATRAAHAWAFGPHFLSGCVFLSSVFVWCQGVLPLSRLASASRRCWTSDGIGCAFCGVSGSLASAAGICSRRRRAAFKG